MPATVITESPLRTTTTTVDMVMIIAVVVTNA